MRAAILSLFLLAALLSQPAHAENLVLLHAAGSLREALTEVAARFEAATGSKVQTKYAASGLMRDEIAAGAKAEAFASADKEHRKRLPARSAAARSCCSRATSSTVGVPTPAPFCYGRLIAYGADVASEPLNHIRGAPSIAASDRA